MVEDIGSFLDSQDVPQIDRYVWYEGQLWYVDSQGNVSVVEDDA